ncbi:MAG TPA: 4-vinyl reductase [Longimicrobiaceae bacterium]|nr:4-vinyl reductase [Longimicrobiaceae bacterium]
MASTDQPRRAKPTPAAVVSGPASITPLFPLLLLETMRDMDLPEEVLEDEDVSISLPRRLGLSDVIGGQIRRLQGEVRAKRPQSPAYVADLIRLVIRRPDAQRIFEEAGRRVARHFWERRAGTTRRLVRILPGPFARVAANRALRRMFQQLVGDRDFSVRRWPADLRISRSLSVEADPGGAACAIYAGAFGELLHSYTGREYRIRHHECLAHGGAACRWTVEVMS